MAVDHKPSPRRDSSRRTVIVAPVVSRTWIAKARPPDVTRFAGTDYGETCLESFCRDWFPDSGALEKNSVERRLLPEAWDLNLADTPAISRARQIQSNPRISGFPSEQQLRRSRSGTIGARRATAAAQTKFSRIVPESLGRSSGFFCEPARFIRQMSQRGREQVHAQGVLAERSLKP